MKNSIDQALTLRKMVVGSSKTYSKTSTSSHKKIIAVTSGKGGVGKTNIVTNLGIALSRQGKRVMIVDADLGLGNIDVLLGLVPKYNIDHLFMGKKKLSEVILKGPENILVLPSSSGSKLFTSLSIDQKLTLMTHIEQLKWDVCLIDTGAGISSNVTFFSTAAEEIVVVVSPEPTSITDAYALMKVLSRLHGQNNFKLLFNMVKDAAQARAIFKRISIVTKKFLNVSIEFMGSVPIDKNLPISVCNQRAVVDLFPSSNSSKEFAKIARDLAFWPIIGRTREM